MSEYVNFSQYRADQITVICGVGDGNGTSHIQSDALVMDFSEKQCREKGRVGFQPIELKRIAETGAQDLLDSDQDDQVIERPCLESTHRSAVNREE